MEDLQERISALERAVTDDDHDLSELGEAGEHAARLTALEEEVADIADSVAELDAATQALRGYVGNIKAVNRDVERRVDAALASAESEIDREPPSTDSNRVPYASRPEQQIDEGQTDNDTAAAASDRPLADGHGNHATTSCPTCGHTSEMTSVSKTEPATNGDTKGAATPSAPQSNGTHPPTANSPGQSSPAGHGTEAANTSHGDESESSERQSRKTGSRTIGRANGDARNVLDSVMEAPTEHEDNQSSTGPLGQLRNML